ncbi:MAG: hypothetical protein IJ356_06820 [Erysipelotrichaceae bacterium]|nr:hypothetical protein [Erysipelotrichaceae bacterium]
MLKLMKYEFKQNALSYLGLFLVFLSLSLVVPVMHREMNAYLISMLLQTVFVILAFVILVGVFVNSGRTYLNSMFKRPGYLTMTLPVTTHQLVLSKVIPGMFWMIISLIVVVLGIFLFAFTSLEASVEIVLEAFGDMFSLWFQMLCEYPFECIMYVVGLLGALTKIMMSLYMCLTITHTSWIKNHRTALAIALFVVIQLLSGNILFNGESFSVMGLLVQKFVIYDFDSYFQTYSLQLVISAALQWIQCIIPYVIIWYCLEKKLEIQ